MKFNWATGLTIFFTLFVATLAFILYQSRQVHDSLVVENYYDEDLNYQSHYDKKQNTADLTVKVKMEYNREAGQILITFPIDSVSVTSGTILLFNPYSNKSDVKYDFNLGKEATYKLPVKNIKPGRWKLKIDWKRGEKLFYQEEEIVI
ncbi:MAG: FixH family protein [Saprospiraceae bacterium]|nr:FixH family protein [Saprospiraceae bacterium]MBK8668414.1 FixH family protein [Saprospiraceae bacterium]